MSDTLTQDTPSAACRVTIVIKALNEEKRIAAAIESALSAISVVGGEVILADSFSTDRTIELASAYPIRIVQLANPEDRCCGIGPQLGYQHSHGDFVYILDADMVMLDGFMEVALSLMDEFPDIGGVGGLVIEKNLESLEYLARMERGASHMQAGAVDRLDMGGLYRRKAIEQSGYFSNRNFHSYEELDLAVRLRAAGWRLWRLDVPAVSHYGHDAPPYSLLLRRWRSRYICGLGELLRAALGKSYLRLVLRDVQELRLYVAVILWWILLISVAFFPFLPVTRMVSFPCIILAPVALMVWRKRSLKKAAFSVVSWCLNTLGLLRGLIRPQTRPEERIESIIIREPEKNEG